MSDEVTPSGDPACWLSQVCDECGALIDDDSDTCWRCGTVRTKG
ncbi:hypothetical protein [Paramicrobacterium fandaimingii]|nr:hypothetical protein [Microbacterium fandaimingii]